MTYAPNFSWMKINFLNLHLLCSLLFLFTFSFSIHAEKYFFNMAEERCMNDAGDIGYNFGILGECGTIGKLGSETILTMEDFEASGNYRGLQLIQVTLKGEFTFYQVDFSYMNATKLTSTGGVSFYKSNLSQSVFFQSELDRINFDDSNLNFIEFDTSKLNNINFSRSSLIEGKFKESTLKYIRLTSSNLSDSIFSNVEHVSVNFDKTILSDSSIIGGKINGANFSNSILANSRFKLSHINGMHFYSSILGSAHLGNDLSAYSPPTKFNDMKFYHSTALGLDFANNAIFENSDFFSTNFTSADFENTTLKKTLFDSNSFASTNFSNSDLDGSIFINSDLSNANFSSSKLNSTLFHGLKFKGTDFSNASLINAALIDIYGGIDKSSEYFGPTYGLSAIDSDTISDTPNTFLGTNLHGARLVNVDLTFSDLSYSNFSNTHLCNVSFKETTFEDDSNFLGQEATFNGITLFEAPPKVTSVLNSTDYDTKLIGMCNQQLKINDMFGKISYDLGITPDSTSAYLFAKGELFYATHIGLPEEIGFPLNL